MAYQMPRDLALVGTCCAKSVPHLIAFANAATPGMFMFSAIVDMSHQVSTTFERFANAASPKHVYVQCCSLKPCRKECPLVTLCLTLVRLASRVFTSVVSATAVSDN